MSVFLLNPSLMHPSLGDLVLDAPRLWPAALLSALFALLLAGKLYGPQVRLLPQPWRLMLPVLRCAALVALAASLVKPVAVRPASASEAGAVLILVDRSRSMSIRDMAYLVSATRPATVQLPSQPAFGRRGRGGNFNSAATQPSDVVVQAPLVAVADGLGLLRAGTRDPELASLHEDVSHLRGYIDDMNRARSEMNFARLSDQGLGVSRDRLANATSQVRAAAEKILSQRPALLRGGRTVDALDPLARLLRGPDRGLDSGGQVIAQLSRWADDAQAVSDSHLYESNADVRALCDRLAGMSRFARADLALTQPEQGLLAKIPADVPIFGYTFAEDLQPLPLRGGDRPVRRLLAEPTGVRTNLLGSLRLAMDHLSGQPLQAIVVLSDGHSTGPPAFADYDALVSQLGTGGIPLFFIYCAPDLRLRDVALSDLTAPAISFVGENLSARVQVRASDIGPEIAPVSLSVDDAPPATRPADLGMPLQSIEFPLKFDKAGVHRLRASIPSRPDAPTDDNKHLQRWVKVLDDKVNVGVYAGHASWDFQYVSNALARAPWANLNHAVLSSGDKFSLTPEQILEQGLLILFDVPAAALSEAQWEAVYKLVADRGGSVIMVAGEEHLPQEYVQSKWTADLLPYFSAAGTSSPWRHWPGKDAGFHVAVAKSAGDVEALHLRDDVSNEDAFAQLPPFFQYFSIPELKPAVRTLLVERDSSAPLLVENRVGLGRAFFMAMSDTWRWRLKVGERDQDRFWLQLVRYASDEPYAARAPGVWLDASAVSAQPGQPIHLRARVQDSQHNPSAESTQILEVFKGGNVIKSVTLSSIGGSAGNSGRYQGTLGDLPAGDYQLRLSPRWSDSYAHLDLHIAASFEEEMADLTGRDFPLRRLAETTGGAYLTLGRIRALPDLINHSKTAQTHLVQRPIWDSVYLYAFVVACFAAEWAIRKRVGLV